MSGSSCRPKPPRHIPTLRLPKVDVWLPKVDVWLPPVERRRVDVTTRWTTPTDTLTAAPSPTVAKVNGGVPWIPV